MLDILVTIVAASICVSTPVIFASLGECISQRSGVLNLGLEGIMLVGAIVGYTTAARTNSLSTAIVYVLATGALLGLLYAILTITFRANQSVCGLAMVMFGSGLSGILGKNASAIATFATFTKFDIPVLSNIPVLGEMLFHQDALTYSLYLLVPLVTWYVYRTRWGLQLQALGENPAALDAMGLNVFAMRYIYVILGSAIVAVGGAYITLAYTPAWTDGITAGKGWIASAIVVFAAWNPTKAALGAIFFGAIEVISLRLQSMGVAVPSYFLSMLPYIATVIVLIISTGNFGKGRKTTMPAAIGIAYDREGR
ncbi:MAG: ABC transporter permease [Eubacteriales bacterium]